MSKIEEMARRTEVELTAKQRAEIEQLRTKVVLLEQVLEVVRPLRYNSPALSDVLDKLEEGGLRTSMLETLSQQRDEARLVASRVKEAEARSEQAIERAKAAEGKIDWLELEKTKLESRVQELEGRVTKLDARNQLLEEQATELKRVTEQARSSEETMRDDRNRAQDEINRIRKEQSATLDKLTATIGQASTLVYDAVLKLQKKE